MQRKGVKVNDDGLPEILQSLFFGFAVDMQSTESRTTGVKSALIGLQDDCYRQIESYGFAHRFLSWPAILNIGIIPYPTPLCRAYGNSTNLIRSIGCWTQFHQGRRGISSHANDRTTYRQDHSVPDNSLSLPLALRHRVDQSLLRDLEGAHRFAQHPGPRPLVSGPGFNPL